MDNFLHIPENRIIYKEKYFFVIKDKYPVNPGHLLIISNTLKKDFFELSNEEKQNLLKAIDWAKDYLEKEYNPDSYNIGMNCGEAAGQTVMHFHCHVIPRYKNDMDNPTGGVRGVIPEKMSY